MDVASLVIVCQLLTQNPAGGYDRYAAPPAYGAAAPGDPVYTAAANKASNAKQNPATAVSPNAPIATPVPSNATGSTNSTGVAPRASPPTNTVPNAATAANAAVDTSRAGELVREAVVIPKSLAVEGRGTGLYEVLRYVGDRRRQIDVVRSYWKLACEAAEYHFAWQQAQFLEHLSKVTAQRGGDPTIGTEIATRLATARAQQREAELELNDAQFAVAERAMLPQNAQRPLALDVPHTGIYRTQFERIYSGRTPPARAYLLNRTLPLRKQVIDTRSEGVWAAQDAYEAAFDAYQKNQLPVEEVLTALDDFRTRRGEFIAAVERYNDEIAEYALMSAPEGVPLPQLVGMLIKNPTLPPPDATGAVDEFGNIVPVGYTGPVPTPEPTPDPVSAEAMPFQPMPAATMPSPAISTGASRSIPANALPAAAMPPAQFNPPADAQPLTAAASTNPSPSSPAPTAVVPTSAVVPPSFSTTSAPATLPSFGPPSGANPLRGQPTPAPPPVPASDNGRYRTNKIPLGLPDASTVPPANSGAATLVPPAVGSSLRDPAVVPAGYYASFASLSAGRRAQELVEMLYGPVTLPEAKTTTISLADCLSSVGPQDREAVLGSYWTAAELRARYRIWTQTAEQLEAMSQTTLRFGDSTAKMSAMLRVRSAKLAAEAERAAALADLEAVRCRLTDDVRRPLAGPWLLPDTLPHGGGYKMKLEALPTSLASLPQLQRPVRRIPMLHETLQLRAEAVVAADAAAESLTGRYAQQKTTAHTVLAAIERQARESVALLQTTTRYNLTIGDYALAVLPPTAPREMLVSAMVVDRNAVASRP
jgi:hypothetical protein